MSFKTSSQLHRRLANSLARAGSASEALLDDVIPSMIDLSLIAVKLSETSEEVKICRTASIFEVYFMNYLPIESRMMKNITPP